MRLVDAGNMVRATDAAGLVTISQIKPIFVSFTVPQENLHKIHEKQAGGTNINLILPAALVPATLRFVPNDRLANASQDLGPYLPIIDAAIPALEHCPDGVLVEVMDNTDHVLVMKSGGSLVVDLKDANDTVHISVPLRAAQSSIHQIAEANGPS